ncbi:hypothetical protein GCM10023149_01240 [Mucilaginibacter gynuensis]|uniref:YdhG-like domain-containing protein n=1 Tax=Mucilaginibacter gynuensis TaxID=1302236 RepID=A0ABP8FNP7_9SPHI
MAKQKTTETEVSVTDFINNVADEQKRKDSFRLVKIFEEQTGFKAKMWGPSIIGFGSYHYKYASGHEGDAPLTGFAPRKPSISLYMMVGFEGKDELLARFGKYKAAKGCIYIKKLDDVDTEVFKDIISASVKAVKALYPDHS